MNTHIEKAISICGGQVALAKSAGVTQTAVHKWLYGGTVPAERCILIERATNGEIRCEQLRPDIEWSVLRAPAPAQEHAA